MKKHLRAFFSGNVQGVGFRYTLHRIARKFPVTGFVRNLPDRRVELIAEGEERDVQEFLSAIHEYFRGNIRDVETRWEKPSGNFQGFEVRF